MELTTTFISAFALVFIGELGDKTQIATGTGALANRTRVRIIFSSSALALVSVAGLTVFFSSLIPREWLPMIENIGGVMLIGYGVYLFWKAGKEKSDDEKLDVDGWKLFVAHFSIVFTAELGDKTQIATLALAVENQKLLHLVFIASASALVAVTALTVWGAAKIPNRWIKTIQQAGAFLMAIYGGYMIFS